MKFRFGLLAILLLFFVGVVLADYHSDEKKGTEALNRGDAAVQKKNASLGSARTAQRAARDAKTDADRQHHGNLADGHTQDAAKYKAEAHGHYSQAVTHLESAKTGREAVRDNLHGGRDDAGHAKALQNVNQKLGKARQGVNSNKPNRRRR